MLARLHTGNSRARSGKFSRGSQSAAFGLSRPFTERSAYSAWFTPSHSSASIICLVRWRESFSPLLSLPSIHSHFTSVSLSALTCMHVDHLLIFSFLMPEIYMLQFHLSGSLERFVIYALILPFSRLLTLHQSLHCIYLSRHGAETFRIYPPVLSLPSINQFIFYPSLSALTRRTSSHIFSSCVRNMSSPTCSGFVRAIYLHSKFRTTFFQSTHTCSLIARPVL